MGKTEGGRQRGVGGKEGWNLGFLCPVNLDGYYQGKGGERKREKG